MEVLCKTWGEMARFHTTFTATQDKFIMAFYIKYAKLRNRGNVCRNFPPFSHFFFFWAGELGEDIPKHLASGIYFKHWALSKFKITFSYMVFKSERLSYLMRRICNTNKEVKLKNEMAKDMGSVYCLCLFSWTPKHRKMKTHSRFNAKVLKKFKIQWKTVFYIFRKHLVHNFTF